MSDVVPMTGFTLYYNVPLTPDYINTFYFSTLSQQILFFDTFTHKDFSLQSYQRKRRGWLRVSAKYYEVYNANYMRFRNISAVVDGVPFTYEQKDYYAFVTAVDYINDMTCEIHYEIDVLQTYMFDWTFEQVMVERETTDSDNLGEHLLDEGLPVGDYVDNYVNQMEFAKGNSTPQILGNFDYVVASTMDISYNDSTDGSPSNSYYSGVISGCKMLRFSGLRNSGSTPGVLDWLDNIPGGKEGNVLAIFMCPKPIYYNNEYDTNYTHSTIDAQYHRIAVGATGNTYVPQNKKLLSSPYNNLLIQSSSGESVIFDYSKLTPIGSTGNDRYKYKFTLGFVYNYPIQGVLYPTSAYKGNTSVQTYALQLPTMPSCTWANDTYKAWAALNTGYLVSSIAGSVVDAGLTIGSAYFAGNAMMAAWPNAANSAMHSDMSIYNRFGDHPRVDAVNASYQSQQYNLGQATAGGLIGDFQNIVNNLIAIDNAKLAPDSFNGTAQNLLQAACGYYGFTSCQHSIRADYAKVLDEYFMMFGYKVNKIKTPVLQQRSRFTYIKTANMSLHGLIPADDIVAICNIFNKGIRWWIDRTQIGIYYSNGFMLPNTPAVVSP